MVEFPDRTGVCHVVGEEGGKHLVGDVVVCGDVKEGVGECVGATSETG